MLNVKKLLTKVLSLTPMYEYVGNYGSAVFNTSIQTTTERQICMWRIGWNARDNRLRQYGWDCVSIYNSNHCILEFHSNVFCGITSDRGCVAC